MLKLNTTLSITPDQRPFAATGKTVSALGFGTVKVGRNNAVKYPGGDGFALPSDGDVEALLDLCIDCGITLLDTAPAYGTSEERLGKLLGARREKFFLVTKTGEEFEDGQSRYDFSAAHTRFSVERSLQRLNTGHLDCVLVHCSRNDVEVLVKMPVLETLARLKDEGKILSFGASTHTIDGGRCAVDLSDCVMLAYNAAHTEEKPVIDYARERGRAVLVKKGLASGHVGTLGGLAHNIQTVTNTPGVTSLVFGSLNPANILANINALLKG